MPAAFDIQFAPMKRHPKSNHELAGNLQRNLPDTSDPVNVLTQLKNREVQLESGSVQPMSEEDFWKGATKVCRPGGVSLGVTVHQA